jgi:hypothetical protein
VKTFTLVLAAALLVMLFLASFAHAQCGGNNVSCVTGLSVDSPIRGDGSQIASGNVQVYLAQPTNFAIQMNFTNVGGTEFCITLRHSMGRQM